MDQPLVQFKNVSFFYVNQDAPEDIQQISQDDVTLIFNELDLSLPQGVLSIIGENGIGKSTLMMLSAGRLFPVRGNIEILGRDTSRFHQAAKTPSMEAERNALASVVYQNMEFESSESVGDMIDTIFQNGLHEQNDSWVVVEGRKAFEIDGILGRQFQNLSKGEMQRTLMAMAIAYGSAVIFMDEPVFAMEEYQKEKTLEYMQHYSHQSSRSLVFSAHNIHLTRKYADNTLLMRKDGNFVLGSSEEVCTNDVLEAAYQVPMDFLHKKEQLYRDMLNKGVEKPGQN